MPPVTTKLDERVAYFYVSQKRPRRSEPIDIFRSLLTQLAWSEDGISIADPLKLIYGERGKDNITGGGEPTLEECTTWLADLTASWSRTMIIIDGLDESSDPWEVLSCLKEVFEKSASQVNIFVSSRMHVEVPHHFPDCRRIEVGEGNDSGDMDAYTRGEVYQSESSAS